MSIFAKLRAGVETAHASQTQSLAAEFARALPADVTLALHGNLGVGKTTFVQGLALGFGIEGAVTSPTFTIFTLYRGPRTLVHLDAYRLERDAHIASLMLEDFLISPYCLAIEWPEKIANWIPKDALHLTLGISRGGNHTVQLA
jgi:tRNA threonylcarbamoyladenosine biosynthesis protein TsaE